LRPDLQVIQDDKVHQEVDPIGDMAIKMETIDFNYVPIRGWRAKGNSIYGMSITEKNIRFSEPFLNSTLAYHVERLGHMEPLKVPYVEAKPPPTIPSMTKPFRNTENLEWGIDFINKEPKLNYDTQPAQFEDANLFTSHWQKSLFVPDTKQMAWTNSFPKGSEPQFDTEPSKNDNIQSSVGLGTMTFDTDSKGI
jgi:hypothetical protein